ncbi:hypothetical protein DFJ74DRAFT_666716 [Hyaloraphidium curvatum]|nr:hypothetical protein DFJ74DRAFT_666716 [Hyaloraphidium curvatum]
MDFWLADRQLAVALGEFLVIDKPMPYYFLVDAFDFRYLPAGGRPAVAAKAAKDLYAKYIHINGVQNLAKNGGYLTPASCKALEALWQVADGTDVTAFDAAVEEIENLMKRDSFSRFKSRPSFKAAAKAAKIKAPTESITNEVVQQWVTTPALATATREFLDSEFSAQNFDFLSTIYKLRTAAATLSPARLKRALVRAYVDFVLEDGPFQVNLPMSMSRELDGKFTFPTARNTFDAAIQAVEQSLEKDFRLFKKTPAGKAALSAWNDLLQNHQYRQWFGDDAPAAQGAGRGRGKAKGGAEED